MAFNIEEELKKLPSKPGVYLMHDERDAIIYVGKAISLKNRVRQYFQSSRNKGVKIEQMVTHIARFEYIITDSELEALVLECNLIKEHRPKYNTMLMDDKAYPFIKVTVQEDFPRVLFARQMYKDKAKYYGPYTSAAAVKDTIDLIHKLYGIRTCNRQLPKMQGKERPCLNYHIHQCPAPCQGYISKEEYGESVKKALHFLNGNYTPILKELEEKMQQAAEEMEFEKAIEYRELLGSVKKIAQKQKITNSDMENKDVIAMAKDREDAVVQVFFIRDGRLIGRDHFCLHIAADDKKEEILAAFVKQFYAGTPYIPREIMMQYEIGEAEVIESWLSERKGQKVHICVPKKGEKEKLVELAQKNAKMVLDQDKERIRRGTKEAFAISTVFSLLISALVCAFAAPLMQIFVSASETAVIASGVRYLRIEGAFYFGIGCLFLLYGYYRAIKRAEMSVVLTVISLGTRVLLAYMLSATAIGEVGIWMAIPIGWVLADLTGLLYMKKTW